MAEPRRSARNRTGPYDDLHHKMLRLTPEEKKTAMTQVQYRQASFDNRWKHHNSEQLNGAKMAEACLYYTGKDDKVTCPYCRVFIEFWDDNDDPLEEHRRHATGRCQFLNAQLDNHAGGEEMETSSVSVEKSDSDSLDAVGMTEDNRRITAMRKWKKRMATFLRNWPMDNKRSGDLWAAGFYNISGGTDPKNKDRVKCFACFLELRQWQPLDDPWVEHARERPTCTFVKEGKGQFFIDCVQGVPYVKDLKNLLTQFARQQGIPLSDVQDLLQSGHFKSEEDMRDAVLALRHETVSAGVQQQDD